jgi:hypothetical protein
MWISGTISQTIFGCAVNVLDHYYHHIILLQTIHECVVNVLDYYYHKMVLLQAIY